MSDLSRRAEQERTLHKAEMVVESAKRKHGAAMLVGKAMADIRQCLNNPTGEWQEYERAGLARVRQALEDALELLEVPPLPPGSARRVEGWLP